MRRGQPVAYTRTQPRTMALRERATLTLMAAATGLLAVSVVTRSDVIAGQGAPSTTAPSSQRETVSQSRPAASSPAPAAVLNQVPASPVTTSG